MEGVSRSAIAVARHRTLCWLLDGDGDRDESVLAALLGLTAPSRPPATASKSERRRWRQLCSARARKTRLFLSLRSRMAEECLPGSMHQVVLLGAGLDVWFHRPPQLSLPRLCIEVDLPATQKWKVSRLEQINARNHNVHFVEASLCNMDHLFQQLEAVAGWQPQQHSTYFSCLGVVPYLDQLSFEALMSRLATCPGSLVIFDHGLDVQQSNARFLKRAEESAKVGEPWLLDGMDDDAMDALLRRVGFRGAIRRWNGAQLVSHFGISEEWGVSDGPWPCRLVLVSTT